MQNARPHNSRRQALVRLRQYLGVIHVSGVSIGCARAQQGMDRPRLYVMVTAVFWLHSRFIEEELVVNEGAQIICRGSIKKDDGITKQQ